MLVLLLIKVDQKSKKLSISDIIFLDQIVYCSVFKYFLLFVFVCIYAAQ